MVRWRMLKIIIPKETSQIAVVTRSGHVYVCLCIPLSLLGKNLVKTFQWQQRVVGGVVYCAVRVVLKDSGWLVLVSTSSLFLKRERQFLVTLSYVPWEQTMEKVIEVEVFPRSRALPLRTVFAFRSVSVCSLRMVCSLSLVSSGVARSPTQNMV
jgi:hypothetical protein